MSQRRNLERRRRNLAEIREIMNSMKTLAYMETRKLTRFLAAQEAVVRLHRQVAGDLLQFYPGMLPPASPGAADTPTALYLLLGSERGLCGNFNHALVRYLDRELPREGPAPGGFLCIGRKLAGLMAEDHRVVGVIEGASVVEEVPLRLSAVVDEIRRIQAERGLFDLYAVVHGTRGVERYPLLPPFGQREREEAAIPREFSVPPLLNEVPEQVFTRLVDQHLFALLQLLLYTGLMEENHLRVTHLDSAVRHLDDEGRNLVRRSNILRQEEIIEEIEVILLSAASLVDRGAGRIR